MNLLHSPFWFFFIVSLFSLEHSHFHFIRPAILLTEAAPAVLSIYLIFISISSSQTEDNVWKQELKGSTPAVLILQTSIYGKSIGVPLCL